MSVACTENCACCRNREASTSVEALATGGAGAGGGAGGGAAGGGLLPEGGGELEDPPPPPQPASATPDNNANAAATLAASASWAPASVGASGAASVSRSSVFMDPPGTEPTVADDPGPGKFARTTQCADSRRVGKFGLSRPTIGP